MYVNIRGPCHWRRNQKYPVVASLRMDTSHNRIFRFYIYIPLSTLRSEPQSINEQIAQNALE